MKEPYLVPFNSNCIPEHVKVHPRCFSCKKNPVCNIKDSYLKTAMLIQNIMGNPAENMEVGVADTTNFDRKLL